MGGDVRNTGTQSLYNAGNTRYSWESDVSKAKGGANMTLQKQKVLIVDDQESVLLIQGRLAKFAGYEPITASDGDEALKLARSEPIQLILLDVMMPGKNGFEVVAELHADPKTKDIPIIIITALDTSRDENISKLSGVAHILSKPVPAKELQEILKKYLGPPTDSTLE